MILFPLKDKIAKSPKVPHFLFLGAIIYFIKRQNIIKEQNIKHE
jgi:hypothetical protein